MGGGGRRHDIRTCVGFAPVRFPWKGCAYVLPPGEGGDILRSRPVESLASGTPPRPSLLQRALPAMTSPSTSTPPSTSTRRRSGRGRMVSKAPHTE